MAHPLVRSRAIARSGSWGGTRTASAYQVRRDRCQIPHQRDWKFGHNAAGSARHHEIEHPYRPRWIKGNRPAHARENEVISSAARVIRAPLLGIEHAQDSRDECPL